ncbi:hypothetical protein ACH40D_06235 [Streptomyces olivaceoviridis]|uniref:Uncharacterized protein n=1 Tax=Streptomyces olivaceoviridis TaxID=1921 RepID=A0ABW7V6X7_STROI|nr:hypothetical protein [Streptomyces corchorusii]
MPFTRHVAGAPVGLHGQPADPIPSSNGVLSATAADYRQLLVWARKRGAVRRAGAEGTGTFGAGLSRYPGRFASKT